MKLLVQRKRHVVQRASGADGDRLRSDEFGFIHVGNIGFRDFNIFRELKMKSTTFRGIAIPVSTALSALLVALLTVTPVLSQTDETIVEDFKPSSLNQNNKQFPQVNSERRVRTRVLAAGH